MFYRYDDGDDEYRQCTDLDDCDDLSCVHVVNDVIDRWTLLTDDDDVDHLRWRFFLPSRCFLHDSHVSDQLCNRSDLSGHDNSSVVV